MAAMKARKIGGSIFLHVPAAVVRRYHIEDGDALDFDERPAELVVKPKTRPKTAMRRLLDSWEQVEFNGARPTLAETTAAIGRDREEHE